MLTHPSQGSPQDASNARPILEVCDLVKAFGGHRAVDGVSFRLARGAIGGLIGPNGAGKTTLFHCIAGALAPTSGSVLLEGVALGDGSPPRAHAAGLGRTFQIPRPFPALTVLENAMLGARAQLGERFWAVWFRPGAVAADERRVREAARHWLDFVGLTALEHEPASVLSGGQRKLLELARAMVGEPSLVLLDEPGAGVNPALLDRIVDRIAALHAGGTGFLVIEHNMDLVATLCRPVMVMSEGRLLASGEARDVLADPRVVEAYLGEAA
jgi:branched-chain amino acid transport system ATP-binding protein